MLKIILGSIFLFLSFFNFYASATSGFPTSSAYGIALPLILGSGLIYWGSKGRKIT